MPSPIIAYHRAEKVFFFEGWEKNAVLKRGKEIPDDVLAAFKIASAVFKNKSAADIETDAARDKCVVTCEINGGEKFCSI
ncbi:MULTISPECIES: hypothetical protein [Brenneria]|uniref:Uncharacterized protein n=1 Tax=Brenneria nigrifluens DSM 30175 = ATCC 13028 TaxID=1121120 RepID=A0A2U1UWH8_9GAMM|nr:MULTISPECIES: hypothetical protein [Brenneria]PWC25970.1 hypothetical protein DDT54_01185 [Brenneria nigrifluens DSM 30175 = ATCC 13028]QCR05644.1 hypothetical protein EH206_16530 [Brenneria nigrifluens DSM 30175 = ATCC 13028]